MKIGYYSVIAVVIFSSITSTTGIKALFANFSTKCKYQESDFFLLAKSIEMELRFFEDSHDQLVLDAALGTRILHQQMSLVLDWINKEKIIVPLNVLNYLGSIADWSRRLTDLISQRKNTVPVQPNTLKWITLESLWKTPKIGHWSQNGISSEKINVASLIHDREAMDEAKSDQCIGELFNACKISDECKNLFLGKPLTKYSLTHQIIYLHVAEQNSCLNSSSFPSASEWDKIKLRFCTKAFEEAKAIQKLDYPVNYRDLFTEQVVVCSVLGFKEFLIRDWMFEILFWQKEASGGSSLCFPSSKNERKKRSDAFVDVGSSTCSAHFTAVGISALGLHLRKFLEDCLLASLVSI